MGHKKLIRFNAIKTFPNVLEYPQGMPGQWKFFFKNDHPITLELACGKGEYTVGLSRMYPHRNFIGIDLKGNRLYHGALESIKDNLLNAAFLRTQIDKIESYFLPGEVSEIWITFPDPQLRTSRAKKRLTHPHFLRFYQQILKPNGMVHVKTDSPQLFFFTRLIADLYELPIEDFSEDVYGRTDNPAEMHIRTHYEKLDIAESKKVFYLRFRLPAQRIPEPDTQLQEFLKQIEKA